MTTVLKWRWQSFSISPQGDQWSALVTEPHDWSSCSRQLHQVEYFPTVVLEHIFYFCYFSLLSMKQLEGFICCKLLSRRKKISKCLVSITSWGEYLAATVNAPLCSPARALIVSVWHLFLLNSCLLRQHYKSGESEMERYICVSR